MDVTPKINHQRDVHTPSSTRPSVARIALSSPHCQHLLRDASATEVHGAHALHYTLPF
ncbi:uncharacterized protein STEHIDRAFT_134984 [Stereum hirsutum FP-91666 SS1]|uniref:uncharacterized protein n=1 Tax=Stereum hirsutum (strain FP-91666) TaxID=721885 RepID=UPI00044497FC|nr:uncharacterized protein STEHIDRAFT_134984 [Stereum hirsutum FP-91666 SS1]EIM80590.1 hypothetical protein STEHIDRAFT_134984 [Stereum hirsutum FP-91666 SS1]